MTVGLKAHYFWFPIGTGDFLHSFFSTISYNLEPNGWGTKYPVLLKSLYHEQLDKAQIPALQEELNNARELLMDIPPNKVIWDIEDLSKRPPWGDDISPEITSLGNYFVSSDSKQVFDIFLKAIETALQYDLDLRIHSM
ncbi:immunity 70 family protein [Paenibacillus sp. PR3]|uniref:Immunity 70 family protein n=1 Tax=Paenibacillus terricola TaxID=2763503 RepID=A0ABR8MYJ3_9BACL|nr:immunity 70 family protein [Paenibacillus terricola]MBD3921020.1 immunity 70 family protein [Paenibacillus terricola]